MSLLRRIPLLLPLLLLPVIAGGGGAPLAYAQESRLQRCVGPGGDTIYTDRPCDSIGAAARLPRGASSGSTGARRGGCARTVQALIHEITYAIDNRDVNRLGAVYHWIGHSPESGYRVLDQLQAVVERPLVDIVPLRAGGRVDATAAPAIPAGTAAGAASPPAAPAATPATHHAASSAAPTDSGASTAAIAPTPRRTVVGLRLEQTLKNGSTPSRTVFGLRRHLDCWWIVF